MNVRRTLTWVAVAMLGVGLTTAMTMTTTLLTQQSIALSSEPLSAGNALVPRKAAAPANAKTVVRHGTKAKPRAVVRVPTTSAPAASAKHVSPPAPSGTQPSVTHASSGTPTPTVTHGTVARKPKGVVPSESSGDQGNQDSEQDQEGAVQSEQRGDDD